VKTSFGYQATYEDPIGKSTIYNAFIKKEGTNQIVTYSIEDSNIRKADQVISIEQPQDPQPQYFAAPLNIKS
jgi:hypothetical protein